VIPCPADDQLRLLLDEQLPADVAEPMSRHTDQCPACQRRMEQLLADGLPDSLRGVLAPTTPGPANPQSTAEFDHLLQRLKTPTAPPLPERLDVPDYEVLEVFGRGGMGVVYKARQRSLNRLVALKMVLSGAHARQEELARFRREAEAVASLQHPNIVQIYQVGEHDGCPFLSLEFLDGGSLDAQMAGTPQLPLPAARLVETLARAVHHAHQHGIIHRDLKPANVLLTKEGMPKISDFGLAKFVAGQGPTIGPERTETGAILGTPSYMAPEQAGGQTSTVGPQADVYALGAILYELLTGRPPFRAASPLETLREVQSEEPVPPARLQPKVPRDLETICLACLGKEPARRYASAEALAEDLRRFQAGEPIVARPIRLWERGIKWARRRPSLAALVGVIVLAALVFVAGMFWHLSRLRTERDLADRNFRRARQAVDAMLTEVAEEHLASEPHMEEKRRLLLEKALQFYREFLDEKRDDPAIQQETALASERVGDILRLLGWYDQATDAYRQAIALLTPLATRPVCRQALANCHNFLGEVSRHTGRPRDAADAYHEALHLQDALVAEFPDEPDYRMERARTHYNLGILAKDTSQLGDAHAALLQAITDLEELAGRHPEVPRYRQHLARSYLNMGPVFRRMKLPHIAKEQYEEAIALLQRLAKKDPDNRDYRHELGIAHNNLGNLLASGECEHSVSPLTRDAETEHAAAVRLFTALTGESPGIPVYRQELANSCNSLGGVLAQKRLLALPARAAALAGCAGVSFGSAPFLAAGAFLGGNTRRLAAAQRAYEQAADVLTRLVKDYPNVPEYAGDLGMTYGNLGWLLTEWQKWPEARIAVEQAIGLLQKAVQPAPANPAYQNALRNQYQTLAETALQLGDHAAAAAAAAALPRVFGDGLDYYYAACFVARCRALAQETAVRQSYVVKAVELLRAAAARGVPAARRLPDLEKAYLEPLGREALAALAALKSAP
jgi:tetratricopeptide (TPR) repeat protein/tRNA A-37 threonylcarbamoyl transferase component Bud32